MTDEPFPEASGGEVDNFAEETVEDVDYVEDEFGSNSDFSNDDYPEDFLF